MSCVVFSNRDYCSQIFKFCPVTTIVILTRVSRSCKKWAQGELANRLVRTQDPVEYLFLKVIVEKYDVNSLEMPHAMTSFERACESEPNAIPIALYRLMIHRGAMLNRPLGQPAPLHYAAAASNAGLCQLLITHGAAVSESDRTARTPLDYAYEAAEGPEKITTIQLLDSHDAKKDAEKGCCTVM
jgi:hypothetical protein